MVMSEEREYKYSYLGCASTFLNIAGAPKVHLLCSVMIITINLKMQKVLGIWTKYHLLEKYLEKYLNTHKLTCIWYSI